MTACGGSALTNDAKIAPDTQKNACETNPLAEGCQAGAGFLSVGLDEGIGNQEAEPSVAPPTPEPVVNTPPAPKPVVKKTEPAPITSVDTSDFTPKTSLSTQSAPAKQRSGSAVSGDSGASGQQSADVTAAGTAAFTDLPTERDATLTNQFLEVGTWTHEESILEYGYRSHLGSKTFTRTPLAEDRIIRRTVRMNELDRTGAVIRDSLRMNLADATFDGVAIGGQAADGIDFFTTDIQQSTFNGNGTINSISLSRYHYAGILSGTDLGAPLTTNPTATWNGSFRTHNTNAVDFQLTVGFGATDPDRTISAFVKDASRRGDYYYLLAGTYTTAGLITGTVNWGEFTGGAQNAPVGGNNGILRGLIGQEGAVGVFLSGSAVHATNGKVTGGTGQNTDSWGSLGYAGGFVASASFTGNPDVTFGDWTRDTARSATLNKDTRASEFLVGGATGISTTGAIVNVISRADCEAHNANPRFANNQITCALTDKGSLNLAGARFGEVTGSGVAFFKDDSNYYAGLLSGTDLGAPITNANQVGMWKGKYQVIGSAAINKDFTLMVTFGVDATVEGSVGSIEALVVTNPGFSHFVKGTFNAAGIIKGTTVFGNFTSDIPEVDRTGVNGVLTGLIGVDGAVGAFHSALYSGGFVASPRTPDVEHEVVFADWTRSFGTAPADAPTTLALQSEFLQTTGSTLATGTLTANGGAAITVTKLNLNTATLRNQPLGGDADDGVAFYRGHDSGNSAGYAGIFSTTDLGGPITAKDARAQWAGQFQVIAGRIINTDFMLEVTFGAVAGVDGSVGKVEAFVEQIAPNVAHHYVRGTFNAAGVIKGTAIAGDFTNGDRNQFGFGSTDGILTGLIGEDGAVGTFYAHAGNYVGGFVAQPTVFVNYDNWLDSLDTFPQAAGTHTGEPPSQFLQGGETQIDPGGVRLRGDNAVTVYTLTMAGDPTRFTGGEDPEKVKNGVSFFQGHTGFEGNTSFSPRMFAGMLSGTDMGLPLAPYTSGDTVKATWAGKIRWTGFLGGVNFPGSDATARDIDLVVNYQDSTLEAFVKMDLRNHHLLLKAGYNELGQFTDGTVKYGIFAGADRDAVRTADGLQSDRQFDKPFDGTLTGIIGQEGAVGVFINDKVTGDYGFAGGFWVTPPE